jgi:hypothetical protein
MNFKPARFSLDKTYFKNCQVDSEFHGRLVSFGFTKEYVIGTCQVESISKILDDGSVTNGEIKFIWQKKGITPFNELYESSKELSKKKLTLTFKGFSQKGYPVFFHKFE